MPVSSKAGLALDRFASEECRPWRYIASRTAAISSRSARTPAIRAADEPMKGDGRIPSENAENRRERTSDRTPAKRSIAYRFSRLSENEGVTTTRACLASAGWAGAPRVPCSPDALTRLPVTERTEPSASVLDSRTTPVLQVGEPLIPQVVPARSSEVERQHLGAIGT